MAVVEIRQCIKGYSKRCWVQEWEFLGEELAGPSDYIETNSWQGLQTTLKLTVGRTFRLH